jgi:HPt (histidine-containing phosphotransfer) domain-containing protein
MDDYVPKPVKPEELGAVLARWVPQEVPEPDSLLAWPGAPAIPEKTGDEESLDPEVLAGLRELGGAEMLAELAEMFLDDASSGLATLREAIEAGDANSVERVAHTLKGSSGNMGAKGMAAICAELQDTGSSGDLSCAPELLEQLEDEFERVRPALEAEIAGDGD